MTSDHENQNPNTVRIEHLLTVLTIYILVCFLLLALLHLYVTQPAAPAGMTPTGITNPDTTSEGTTQPFSASSDSTQLTTTQKKDLVQAVSFIVAGAVAAVGLYFTGRTLQNTLESTRRTLYLTEEGQVTDRFSSAIEHLGATTDVNGQNPQLETRLGGIYALERIAWDSRRDQDYWTIMEVLTAYVRQNAPWPSEESPANADPSRSDIQGILAVLGRRNLERETEDNRLDLRKTNLRNANLNDAHLERARFKRANLEGAFLNDAKLNEASFRECSLKGAVLQRAHLEGAKLNNSNLEGAHLDYAYLDNRTILDGACLRGAYLTGTRINGTNLRKVIGLTPEQLDIADTDATVSMPNNKDIVRYLYKQFFRHKILVLADYIYSTSHVLHSPLGEFHGPDGVRDFVGSFNDAFPNLKFAIGPQTSTATEIQSPFSMSGTHSGETFHGIPATFRNFEVTGTIHTSFAGTRVVEEWFEYEHDYLVSQLSGSS